MIGCHRGARARGHEREAQPGVTVVRDSAAGGAACVHPVQMIVDIHYSPMDDSRSVNADGSTVPAASVMPTPWGRKRSTMGVMFSSPNGVRM